MRRVTDSPIGATGHSSSPATKSAPGRRRPLVRHADERVRRGGRYVRIHDPSGRRALPRSRVEIGNVEDPDSYEWFKGAGTWESDPDNSHVVLPAPVEELSVAYNAHLDKFVALTSMSSGVVSMRVADEPQGPWSPPQTLVDRRMFPNAYAPMIHPASITSSGSTSLHASTWDAYNVFLLRTDLDGIRLRLAHHRCQDRGPFPRHRGRGGEGRRHRRRRRHRRAASGGGRRGRTGRARGRSRSRRAAGVRLGGSLRNAGTSACGAVNALAPRGGE